MLNLDCKLHAIEALGNIIMVTEEAVMQHLDEIIKPLQMACDQSLSIGEDIEE